MSGPCDDPNCDICRYIFYSVPEHKVPLGGATDTKIVYQTIPIDESADELVEALKKLEQAEAEVERLKLMLEAAYEYGGFGGLYAAEYDDWLADLARRWEEHLANP